LQIELPLRSSYACLLTPGAGGSEGTQMKPLSLTGSSPGLAHGLPNTGTHRLPRPQETPGW